MINEGDPAGKTHGHYSEQNGHALRGEHARIVKILRGTMPEGVGGFNGIEKHRIRRSMRRITDPGTGR